MIISRTPFRISFFGGGTDFPKWYEKYGGAVLSTSIDKYCYIHFRKLPQFFEYKNRVVWSKIETTNTIDEISHPVVREVMKWKGLNELLIHHDGDLPSRCGLGTSSSFTVGLLNAIYKIKKIQVDKNRLARDAIFVEQKLLNESVGIQDQIAVAMGGFNKIKIKKDGQFSIKEIKLNPLRKNILESRLMMFYTGISRNSSSIASSTINQIFDHKDKYHALYKMVERGQNILLGDNNIDDFGYLLNEAWEIKRKLSSLISSNYIDDIYKRAINAGALGGKLLGSGGGGFMIFFSADGKQEQIKQSLKNLLYVPFQFEQSGSQIVYHS